MRLSTDPSDPGYQPTSSGIRILLDGEELFGCVITADEEQGLVLCYVRSQDGTLLYDKMTGRLDMKVLRGHVVIERDETIPTAAAH